jgi:hypothetical protein
MQECLSRSPTREQRFVLGHVAGIADLAATGLFEAARPELIDAIPAF